MGDRTSPSALTFAKLLGEGPMARVALEASLSEIVSPAFIVSAKGTVLHANPAGRKQMARTQDRLRSKLARAVKCIGALNAADPPKARQAARECEVPALVTPLRCDAMPLYYLVIFRPPSHLSETIEYAAKLWDLTPRQRDVLALVAEGFSNKTIAVRLGCAPRTVETHLTVIFKKSGVDGRGSLLAAIAQHKL